MPSEHVGDVMGDLNSRRGHPLGMEARGHDEVVRAEVPMAEMLEYAPDLRAMTGGRGDYAMQFDHYAQVPAHLAEKAAATRRPERAGCTTAAALRWGHAGRPARSPPWSGWRRRRSPRSGTTSA